MLVGTPRDESSEQGNGEALGALAVCGIVSECGITGDTKVVRTP